MTLFDPEPELGPDDEPTGPRVRLRLLVAYDGAAFRGIAFQAGQRTVVGVLADALSMVLRGRIDPAHDVVVAGRTDAGVHAWGQVLHIDLPAGIDPDPADVGDLPRRLAKLLRTEVVVRAADVVDGSFDARRTATSRCYRYSVLNRPVADPFLARTTWWVPEPLDLRSLRAASDPLIGSHDFASFCRRVERADGAEASLVRKVLEADWVDLGDGVLRFDIEATAFCRQMVRAIVGTLVEVGRGRRSAGDMAATLRARSRSAAGLIAPPQGLVLWQVRYDGAREPRHAAD